MTDRTEANRLIELPVVVTGEDAEAAGFALRREVERMQNALGHCVEAITALDIDALGWGWNDDGTKRWPLRDELIAMAQKAALRGEEGQGEN